MVAVADNVLSADDFVGEGSSSPFPSPFGPNFSSVFEGAPATMSSAPPISTVVSFFFL